MVQKMIDQIKKFIGLDKDKTKSILVINKEKLETRVALLEDGKIEEYAVERQTDRQIVGNIYKGKVKNIEQGLKAMFVDIGFEKNAFLHFWDAIPAALDNGIERVSRKSKGKQRRKITSKDIPEIYPVGSDVIVQVTKGPIGTKGPRITTNLSLAGRYLVLMPYSDQSGVSRKIDDPQERQRLREILQKLTIPDGMGVIIRTVGEGQRLRHFIRDLGILLDQWDDIEDGMENKRSPALLLEEPDLIKRTVRDFLTEDVDRVICDSQEAIDTMSELVGQISRRARKRIHLYQDSEHIFEKFDLQRQIDDAFHRQVWLPCGGYIVIDETEALIAIDVNTGRNKGQKDMDKTILQTNLEAADEIARQLRLRNIGGLIIGDFIDMKHRRDQQQVYSRIKQRLKRDKSKTHVLPISQLGLMEMTRQRAQESLVDTLYMPCPHCNGRGMIKTPMSMSVEVQRTLHSLMRKHQDTIHEFKVTIHPSVLERLRTEDEELLIQIERTYAGRLLFVSDPTLPEEHFTVHDAKSGKLLNDDDQQKRGSTKQ